MLADNDLVRRLVPVVAGGGRGRRAGRHDPREGGLCVHAQRGRALKVDKSHVAFPCVVMVVFSCLAISDFNTVANRYRTAFQTRWSRQAPSTTDYCCIILYELVQLISCILRQTSSHRKSSGCHCGSSQVSWSDQVTYKAHVLIAILSRHRYRSPMSAATVQRGRHMHARVVGRAHLRPTDFKKVEPTFHGITH